LVTLISCIYVRKSNPFTGIDRPRKLQEIDTSRFLDNRHVKVVRLSVARNGHLCHSLPISLRGWTDPRAIVRPQEICQWKIPLTPWLIERATFRLSVRGFNYWRHRMLHVYMLAYYNIETDRFYVVTLGRNIRHHPVHPPIPYRLSQAFPTEQIA